jgi:Protein of unknown function (DUF1266)
MIPFLQFRLVLLLYLISAISSFVMGAENPKQTAAINQEQQQVLSGPKGWAVGCSAVLMERNHSRIDTLATNKMTEVEVNDIRRLLDEWWGIKTKEDLLDTLYWLETEGHRQRFDRVAARIVFLTDEQYKAVVNAAGDDKESLQEMRIVKKYAVPLRKKGILGWDYCRYINLCRWGYTIGLLSEEEAWEKIMPIARKLQDTFDSWEDLGCNYLIGFQFWSYKQMVETGPAVEDAIQRLVDMPSSPWNKYPWNMNLDSDKDANDVNEPNSRKTAEEAK